MTTASAPASSANLGPAFDVMALALDLRCRVSARRFDAWRVTSGGVAATPETVEMVRRVAGGSGSFEVEIDSDIPAGRGLGSSAAVLVAAAAAMAGGIDQEHIFELAGAVEGHLDNVAAATYGGLVAVAAGEAVHRLGVHPSLQVAIAVPDAELSTAAAREALSAEIPRAVAVRTAARVAMLVEGLRTANPVTLAAALGDEMHETARAAMTERPARLIDAALSGGALYASWSGAGPSVIAFADEVALDQVIGILEAELGDDGRVVDLEIDRTGVRLE